MRVRRPRMRVMAISIGMSLALVASSSGSAVAGPGDVRDAKAQLAAMQAKIDKIAAGLDKGTHAYTAGQRHLAEVQRTERSIRRQLDQLRAASVQGQLRL